MTELLSQLPSLQAYLLVAAMLFCIGVWGLINSRNAVRVLMSIELMLNGVNINLMAFSSYVDGDLIRGQVFAVFVITVAAAAASVRPPAPQRCGDPPSPEASSAAPWRTDH